MRANLVPAVVMIVIIVMIVMILPGACGRAALTRDAAADLLSKSMSARGTELLPVVTPTGCISVDAGVAIERIDPRKQPGILGPGDGSDGLQRLVALDLLEFELSEFPVDAPTAPPGCETLWITHQTGRQRSEGRLVKLVAWRTMLSDKALAAGLQVGQSFLYRRRTLMSVDRLEPAEGGVTRVSYTWRWEPTDEGAHLRIPASAPETGTARFKRTPDGWQIVP
jgi:hypothetical protein